MMETRSLKKKMPNLSSFPLKQPAPKRKKNLVEESKPQEFSENRFEILNVCEEEIDTELPTVEANSSESEPGQNLHSHCLHREKLYPFFHLILALKTIFLLFMAAFSTGPRRAPIILPAQCLKTCYSLTRLTASLTILSAVSCTSIVERPPLLLEWVVLFLHVYPIMRSSRVVPLRLVALFAV